PSVFFGPGDARPAAFIEPALPTLEIVKARLQRFFAALVPVFGDIGSEPGAQFIAKSDFFRAEIQVHKISGTCTRSGGWITIGKMNDDSFCVTQCTRCCASPGDERLPKGRASCPTTRKPRVAGTPASEPRTEVLGYNADTASGAFFQTDPLRARFFRHVDDRQGDSVFQGQVDRLQCHVAAHAKELCPGQG